MADNKQVGIATEPTAKAIETFKTTMSAVPKPKEFGRTIVNSVKGLGDRVADKVSDAKETGDNVYVVEGTKTLIGTSFADLYSGEMKTDSVKSGDKSVSVLSPTSDYDTEMKSSLLRMNEPMTYGDLSDDRKLIYEMTLLTKKYVNDISQSPDNQAALAKEYAETAAKYKKVCDDMGMEWDGVIQNVSYEFQFESLDAKEKGDKDSLMFANKGHSLCIQAASPDFRDDFQPVVESGGLSYNDTLTTDKEAVDKIASRDSFSGKWEDAKGPVQHAGVLLSTGWNGVTSGVSMVFKKAVYGVTCAWSAMKDFLNKSYNNKDDDHTLTQEQKVEMANQNLPSDAGKEQESQNELN